MNYRKTKVWRDILCFHDFVFLKQLGCAAELASVAPFIFTAFDCGNVVTAKGIAAIISRDDFQSLEITEDGQCGLLALTDAGR
jgi:hypothetical protein